MFVLRFILRRFTHKKRHVPEDALTRFAQLITFDADSYRHTLTPALHDNFGNAEARFVTLVVEEAPPTQSHDEL